MSGINAENLRLRLAALADYNILDTPREARFDAIVRNLADTVKTPIAYISFVDETRLWFKSSIGLPFLELPAATSLTSKLLNDGVPEIVVPDIEKLPTFAPNKYATDRVGARSILGSPIVTPEGVVIGAVCVMDVVPRNFTEEDQAALVAARNTVLELLELRRVVETSPISTQEQQVAEVAIHQDFEENLQQLVASYISETLENFDWWAGQAWWYDDEGLNPAFWITAAHTPKSLKNMEHSKMGSVSVAHIRKAYLEPTLVPIEDLEWMQNSLKLTTMGARHAVVLDVFGAAVPTLRLVFIIPSARFFDENTKKFFSVTTSLLPKVITRERVRGELQYRSIHDALTGLLNRRGLNQWIEDSKAESTSNRAVMFLDLDNFKSINDKYGHAIGDELLIHVARELSANTRPTDNVARIGGDEFVIVTAETNLDVVDKVLAKRVFDALSKPVILSNGVSWSGAASIGVAGWPAGTDFNRALEFADAMMYNAKKAGGGIAFDTVEGQPGSAALDLDLKNEIVISKIALSETAAPWACYVAVESKLKNPDLDKLAKEILDSLAESKMQCEHVVFHLPKSLWFEEEAISYLLTNLKIKLPEVGFSVVLNGNGASADAKALARNLRLKGHARTVLSGFGSGNKEFELLQSIQPVGLILDADLVNSVPTAPDNELSVRAVTAICDALEIKAIAPRGTSASVFALIKELGVKKQFFSI